MSRTPERCSGRPESLSFQHPLRRLPSRPLDSFSRRRHTRGLPDGWSSILGVRGEDILPLSLGWNIPSTYLVLSSEFTPCVYGNCLLRVREVATVGPRWVDPLPPRLPTHFQTRGSRSCEEVGQDRETPGSSLTLSVVTLAQRFLKRVVPPLSLRVAVRPPYSTHPSSVRGWTVRGVDCKGGEQRTTGSPGNVPSIDQRPERHH